MFWKKKKEESIDPTSDTTASPSTESQSVAEPPRKMGLFAKLRDRLKKTRESITQKAINLFRLHGKIDEDLLEQLEEALITADVGVHTTMALMKELRERIRLEKKANSTDSQWLTDTLQSLIQTILEQGDQSLRFADNGPSIYMVIGVNGVGKTTAIGKLAYRLKQEGKNVLLVAADTFRAAAIEQLEIWSKRAEVPIVLGKEGADPSSVVYNALVQCKDNPPDVVIIDTAGRLHTKSNLMQELSKMSRIINREIEGAPHETLLVLDASTGQNALQQAKQFMQSCNVTGLVLTKLDGTARGGVILAVHQELNLPVKFIGVGESLEDLEPFDPTAFTKALFKDENETVESLP